MKIVTAREGKAWSWNVYDQNEKHLAGGYAGTKRAAASDAQTWISTNTK